MEGGERERERERGTKKLKCSSRNGKIKKN